MMLDFRKQTVLSSAWEFNVFVQPYCWWKISCTTWDVKTLQIMGETARLNWCRISSVSSRYMTLSDKISSDMQNSSDFCWRFSFWDHWELLVSRQWSLGKCHANTRLKPSFKGIRTVDCEFWVGRCSFTRSFDCSACWAPVLCRTMNYEIKSFILQSCDLQYYMKCHFMPCNCHMSIIIARAMAILTFATLQGRYRSKHSNYPPLKGFWVMVSWSNRTNFTR